MLGDWSKLDDEFHYLSAIRAIYDLLPAAIHFLQSKIELLLWVLVFFGIFYFQTSPDYVSMRHFIDQPAWALIYLQQSQILLVLRIEPEGP